MAVDLLLLDAFGNLSDRRKPGVPDGASVILAEDAHELAEPLIGHAGEVRGGVAGVHAGAAAAFDQRHGLARLLEQIGGRDAGDAAAHDDRVDFVVPVERGEGRQRR